MGKIAVAFDFNKSNLVRVSNTHSMKPVSKSVTSFCLLLEVPGLESDQLHGF